MRSRLPAALRLLTVCAASTPAAGQAEVRLGNAVRPWPGRDTDGEAGIAVLDSGLCFSQSGGVVAVEAYIHGVNESGAWPHFYAVESVEDRTWSVRAEASVADGGASFSGATRLELASPLRVETGQCLCWRYPRWVRGVIAFASWPGEQWYGPPGGSDVAAIAMLGPAPRAYHLQESFAFERVRRRRYALQASFAPAEGSLAALARSFLPRGAHKLGPPSSAGTREEIEAWADRCWGQGWRISSQPMFCCLPAGKGKPMCFTREIPYERCCSPSIVGALGFDPSAVTLSEPLRVSLVGDDGAPRSLPRLKVDMFIRTFYPKFEELTLLLRSAAVFWPPDWGAIVALDGQSEPDALACKLLPAWVRCVLIDPPRFLGHLNMSFPMLGGSGRGMVWKEWSECWADRHSSADFIAIMDSDVVLTTFGIPHLLFEEASDGQLQPVIWGHSHENYFPSTVEQLRLPNLVDFMDSFPLTIRREDFAYIRQRITSIFGRRKTARSASAFDWAFLAYVEAVHRASVAKGGGGECPSFHSVAGSLLWYGRRDSYAWYIRHGHVAGVPLRFTCPRLRVAHHVPYWSHEHTEYYQVPSLKPHLRLVAPLGSLGYTTRAVALIMAGLCEVPWQQRRELRRSLEERAAFTSGVLDSTAFDNAAMEDVHREFCEHGMQLVAGISDPFQRLLTWRFPASPVSDEEAAYCGDRRPSALLREYRRLMGAMAFTPD